MLMHCNIQYYKVSFPFKLIYRFNAVLMKIPAIFLWQIYRLLLKFIWKWKVQKVTKVILKKENKVGEYILLDFRNYYKTAVIKTLWYLQKAEWNETKKRRQKLIHKYNHLWQNLHYIKIGERIIISTYYLSQLDIYLEKMNLELYTMYVKIKSRYIKDLNMKNKTIKTL